MSDHSVDSIQDPDNQSILQSCDAQPAVEEKLRNYVYLSAACGFWPSFPPIIPVISGLQHPFFRVRTSVDPYTV